MSAISIPRIGVGRRTLPIAMFLLMVFAVAQPFDPSQAGHAGGVVLDEHIKQVQTGSTQRVVALLTLGTVAAVGFVTSRRSRPICRRGLLSILVVGYVGVALASPLWAQDPGLAIRRAGVFALLCTAAIWLAVRMAEYELASLTVVVCGGTVVISLATELVIGAFNPLVAEWRLGGIMHPVALAWNCGLLVIASLALAAATRGRRRRLLLLLAIGGFACLILTRTRGALMSTIAGMAVYYTIASARSRKVMLVVTFALLSGLLATLIWSDDVGSMTQSIESLGRGGEAASSISTLTGRTDIWKEVLPYVTRRPALGYGYNAFLNPGNLASVSEGIGWVPTSLHSVYLQSLLGLGLVGLFLICGVMVEALRMSLGAAGHSPGCRFVAAVMVWLLCNSFLETALVTDPIFPTLLSFAVIARLAFTRSSLPASKPKVITICGM